MNRSSNIVHYKHTITKSCNFKSVGLTLISSGYATGRSYLSLCNLQPTAAAGRRTTFIVFQCLLPWLFTVKLWHRFSDFWCRLWHERESGHHWKHVPVECVNYPYDGRNNFRLKWNRVCSINF